MIDLLLKTYYRAPKTQPQKCFYLFLFTLIFPLHISLSNHQPTSDEDPLERDFTYVDDIVSGIMTSLDYVPTKCGEKFNLGKLIVLLFYLFQKC